MYDFLFAVDDKCLLNGSTLAGIENLLLDCTGRQCSPLRRKFIECSINSPALSLVMKHLVIGQRLKTPNFSDSRWSPRGSLVSIGQHFVATRVVHLPKSTETSLITESDQSGPNHQLLQICTALLLDCMARQCSPLRRKFME